MKSQASQMEHKLLSEVLSKLFANHCDLGIRVSVKNNTIDTEFMTYASSTPQPHYKEV